MAWNLQLRDSSGLSPDSLIRFSSAKVQRKNEIRKLAVIFLRKKGLKGEMVTGLFHDGQNLFWLLYHVEGTYFFQEVTVTESPEDRDAGESSVAGRGHVNL